MKYFLNCKNFIENSKYLKKITDKLRSDNQKIITYGGSMGGYGALIYGLHINADHIISTGVEHKLMIEGGNSLRFIKSPINSFVPDIRNLLSKFTGTAHIVYGENYIPDIVCANDLKTSSIKLYTLKNKPHSIPPYIEKKFGLYDFILETTQKRECPFSSDELGDILLSDNIGLLHDCFIEIKRKTFKEESYNKLKTSLKKIKSNSEKKYILLYLGIYAYHHGNIKKSMLYLFKSRNLGLNNSELISYIAFCYDDIGSFYKSYVFSSKAVKMAPIYNEKIVMLHKKNLLRLKKVDEHFDFVNNKLNNNI